MATYKKSYIALIISFLIAAPSLRAQASDFETLAVPTMTGLVSGYVYGTFMQKNWIALILSNIFFSRCKDRIFASIDKAYSAKKASKAPIYFTCESAIGTDGVQRATYSFKMDENEENASQGKYEAMSYYDDMVTIATVLAVLMRG